MGPGMHTMMHGSPGGGIAVTIAVLGILSLVLIAAALIIARRSGRPRGLAGSHDSLRASDAARERTIEALAAAYASGQLTPEELEHRTDRALTAGRETDLHALTRDLAEWAMAGPTDDVGRTHRTRSPK